MEEINLEKKPKEKLLKEYLLDQRSLLYWDLMIFMVNKDHSVGDNSMINTSSKVMWSLSTQIDNQKCENQDHNHLKWQLQASNDPLSNSNKAYIFTVYHQNIRESAKQNSGINKFLVS